MGDPPDVFCWRFADLSARPIYVRYGAISDDKCSPRHADNASKFTASRAKRARSRSAKSSDMRAIILAAAPRPGTLSGMESGFGQQ